MKKSKRLNLSSKIMLLSISLFTIASPIFASGVGEKVGKSLTSNINALIPAVLLAIGAYFLFTRDWMKMISFVAIAVIIAIFTNWTWVQAIGSKIYNSFIA
ncbi:hypothetical protein [Paenibacillus ihuae]|uniref:hypothetical protein n=1 Tax=Paenibacillus ihuae TaxID=1232431 RepID=UPI0006D56646|nr:hypothetical protein [Paenibacillus ihuae]